MRGGGEMERGRRRNDVWLDTAIIFYLAVTIIALYLLSVSVPSQAQGLQYKQSNIPVEAVLLLVGIPGLPALVGFFERKPKLMVLAGLLVIVLFPALFVTAQKQRIYAVSDTGERLEPFHDYILVNVTEVKFYFHMDPRGDIQYWNGTDNHWWPAASFEYPEEVRIGVLKLGSSLNLKVQYFQHSLEYEVKAKSSKINETAFRFRYELNIAPMGSGPFEEFTRTLTSLFFEHFIKILGLILLMAFSYVLLKLKGAIG